MKKIFWFLVVLLFVGNCIITILNYRNLAIRSTIREIALSNKAMIMELSRKIVPDEEALNDN